MQAKQFCVLTTTESWAKIWRQWNAFGPYVAFGCCPFYGNDYVVVDLMFNVLPIVCGSYVIVFVMHYFESI